MAIVIDALLKHWKANAKPGESLGYFNRRMGNNGLVEFFKNSPATADLMAKPMPADCVLTPDNN